LPQQQHPPSEKNKAKNIIRSRISM